MSNPNKASLSKMMREFFSNPDIKNLGEDLLKDIRKDLDNELPPKMLFVGKTGVGKSSLINAIFGQEVMRVDILPCTVGTPEQQLDIDTDGGARKIIIYDTQGLDDLTKDNPKAIKLINERIQECDLTIYVFDGSSRAWESDKDILSKLKIDKKPLLVIVNRLDTLEPTREWNPPYELSSESIDKKERNIREKMLWANGEIRSCVSKRDDFDILPVAVPSDSSWNVDLLVQRIENFLPDHMKLPFVRNLPHSKAKAKVCEKIARKWITKYAAASATIAAVPIPIADLLPLTTLQGAMWSHIAYIYGSGNILKSAAAFAGSGGFGFLFKTLAQQLTKLIPGGSIINAAIAIAVTKGYGETAIEYYNKDGNISPKELQNLVDSFVGNFVREVLNKTVPSPQSTE